MCACVCVCVCVCVCSVAQLCLTLCDPMNGSPPGSSLQIQIHPVPESTLLLSSDGHGSTPSILHILWAQQRLALDPAPPDPEVHSSPDTTLPLSWLRETEHSLLGMGSLCREFVPHGPPADALSPCPASALRRGWGT